LITNGKPNWYLASKYQRICFLEFFHPDFRPLEQGGRFVLGLQKVFDGF